MLLGIKLSTPYKVWIKNKKLPTKLEKILVIVSNWWQKNVEDDNTKSMRKRKEKYILSIFFMNIRINK